VLALGALVYAMSRNDESDVARDQPTGRTETTGQAGSNDNEIQAEGTQVIFTDDGFNPSSYTSREGEAVTVRNDSSMELQFSSADHPTHQDTPEFNLPVLGPGESATFTPNGTGTFGFHDHINSQYTGTLTVE